MQYVRFGLVVLALIFSATAAGATAVSDLQPAVPHVVDDGAILARIDGQVDQASADRQAIESLLQRPDVQQIAGSVGLSLDRASDAAAVLSGPALASLAAEARAVNVALAGGNGTIVISATAVIIILLVLILISV